MLIWEFFSWWYGAGWRDLRTGLRRRLLRTYLGFSVPILLRTLVAPWKRIITAQGDGIGGRVRASLDNAVSRCVGLVVRLLALGIAGIVLVFELVAGVVIVICWPAVPVLTAILIGIGAIK